jgi:hypothetical protein
MWSLLNAIISLVESNLSSHNHNLENNPCTMLCRKVCHCYHLFKSLILHHSDHHIRFFFSSGNALNVLSWYGLLSVSLTKFNNYILYRFLLQFKFIFSITIDVILCTSSYFSIHLWFTVFLSLLDPTATWFNLPTLPKTSFRKKIIDWRVICSLMELNWVRPC